MLSLIPESKISFESYDVELKRFEKAAIAAKLDVAMTFDGKNFQRFVALPASRREKLVLRLSLINDLLENSVRLLGAHGGHFYLRSALKRFGWRVPPDVYDLVGPEDTIEIYGSDFSLKAANMRFLQVCSYTMEDILAHEFYELFDRDVLIAQRLMSHWPKLSTGEVEIVTDLGPPHLVQETFSKKKKKFWVDSRVLARVCDRSGRVVGPLYSATVKVLDTHTS